MKPLLCVAVLLGCTLAAPGPATGVRASGGVIYNEAALDYDDTVTTLPYIRLSEARRNPRLTFEVRLDTVRPPFGVKFWDAAKPGWDDKLWTEWTLYLTQTLPDTVRRFRVCRLEVVKP